ncbi:MAG: hypothetical protein LBJ74_04580 [Heliobacteriaceae bacterium]|jgi:beta-N-acetylhexosaminidase|nr:hypothetical protein [Heliobacteriaceae bacterium]
MQLKTKLYQMFILGTVGGGYKAALKQGLGGMIFFTYDIQSTEQFTALVEDIRSEAKIPPFLSIDQEGGRVERTENIHRGKKYLSAKYAFTDCGQRAEDFLRAQTQEIAQELKSYGLNLNFAPCVDVNTNPNNPIIGERAFSDNPEDVIRAEKIVVQTYLDNGIIPCLKHYPGHGDANADSHLTLPTIDKTLEEMQPHLAPFAAAVNASLARGVRGDFMIMAGHLHCTCFDKDEIPASLSKNALDYLRNEIGFDSVIISDDMVMRSADTPDAVERGIRAGLNMFIYRNSTPETIEIIEALALKAENDPELRENIEKSYEKIRKAKG